MTTSVSLCEDEVCEALHSCAPFSALPEEVLAELTQQADIIEAPRGYELYAHANPGTSLFVVIEGTVRVATSTMNGKEITLAFYKDCEFFGEAALRHEDAEDERAVIVEPSRLLVFRIDRIEALMREHAEFALEMTRLLAQRFARLQSRIQNLMYRTPKQRLASLLIELSEDFGRRTNGSGEIEIDLRITQYEMASLIGVTRESVSYAMGDLQLEEIIRMVKRRIILMDLRRLHDVSA